MSAKFISVKKGKLRPKKFKKALGNTEVSNNKQNVRSDDAKHHNTADNNQDLPLMTNGFPCKPGYCGCSKEEREDAVYDGICYNCERQLYISEADLWFGGSHDALTAFKFELARM